MGMSAPRDPTQDLLANWMDYGVDTEHRRVMFYADCHRPEDSDELGIDAAIKSVLFLDRHKKGPIELWICTEGGSVTDAFALYDVMRGCDNIVKTIAIGAVCSAGVLVLAGGEMGERYSTPNAWLMSHPPRYDDGMLTHIEQQTRVAWNQRLSDQWDKVMASRTKHTKKWWRDSHAKGEIWMNPKQMMSAGIIDGEWCWEGDESTKQTEEP